MDTKTNVVLYDEDGASSIVEDQWRERPPLAAESEIKTHGAAMRGASVAREKGRARGQSGCRRNSLERQGELRRVRSAKARGRQNTDG